jgi:hypothetical protein
MTQEERLAMELHKFYRAASLAMRCVSKSKLHDHGWSLCGQKSKKYFLKRAKLMLKARTNLSCCSLGCVTAYLTLFLSKKRIK